MVVLDSSAVVEMVRRTNEGMALQWFIRKNEKTISCDLVQAEIASVFRKFTRTEGLTADAAEDFFRRGIELIDEFYPIRDLQPEVLSESIRFSHSTYDVYYFVLARRTGATLLTLDRKLMRLCEKNRVPCVSEVSLTDE